MKKKLKQYTVENAYDLNYHVITLVDGEIIGHRVMDYSEMLGYTSALEDDGYVKAYYLPKYEKELKEAEEAYNWAKEAMEKAKGSPVKVNNVSDKEYLELRFELLDYNKIKTMY